MSIMERILTTQDKEKAALLTVPMSPPNIFLIRRGSLYARDHLTVDPADKPGRRPTSLFP